MVITKNFNEKEFKEELKVIYGLAAHKGV